MAAVLTFCDDVHAALADAEAVIVIGRQQRLLAEDVLAILPPMPPGAWDDMVRRGDAGDHGRAATTHTGGSPRKITAGILPEPCSRHNAPSRAGAIPGLIRGASGNRTAVILAVDEPGHAFAAVLGAARAFPVYSGASRHAESHVRIAVLANGPFDAERCRSGADAVRFAARLTDVPPNLLTTTTFVESAREVASRLSGVSVTVFQGDVLLTEGLGGLWNVGKASSHQPALVILDYDLPDGDRLGWVGKGITYDTGGLSLKAKTSMPGMKTDMAGAAAVLAAFAAAVQLGTRHKLTAALCIAENAVGPHAMRPDDVIRLYSGRTVEVNNTDAEGRLVLADGLAWVARHRSPRELLDLATLTGAQLVATGKRHAAIYTSDEELEHRAIRAGRASGDLVHPLPYVPELFRAEFHSSVADMKNSVKDRNNAQASCAGEFLHMNLEEFKGSWMHVDLAGPSVTSTGRGTGFGVGLLMTLAGVGA
jgi:probable aminopeptidase NPEPL1